ncbi:MAG TPA: TonB-dependent receptor [Bryobacteraceae bacterium]|nr:TonB-dependent receptor [Bryobacteraceae bacterium]
MKTLFGVAATLWLTSVMAFGQTTLGSAALAGSVKDSSGAMVAAAAVEVTEIDRDLKRETTSNEDGAFLFPTIPPGRYVLRVVKRGFEAAEIRNITLEVGARPSFDVTLTPGGVSSVVSVTAEALAPLETESNVIGTVINSGRVQELPLNGRNYLQLALLSGGAVTPNTRSDAISGQTGRSDNAILLGGNVGSSTGYMIDGIAVRGGRLGESAVNISPAAIDQFKVQMSFFMPDQGPNPGLVNLITKGGNNSFHGEAFEFFRNGNLDARNFFSQVPENLHRNQFGAAIGGPIRKDKTWFFANFESLRELTAFTASGYAPTQAMFNGDFSALSVKVYDPQSYSATTGTRTAFPANMIPADRINPVAKKLLQYYRPGSSLAQKPSNLFANPRRSNDDDQWGVRVDHALTQNQNIFFRYIRERGDLISPGLEPYSGSQFPLETDFATAQHTWTISPALVNNLRIGFVRNSIFSGNEGAALGEILPQLGIANTLDTRGISGIGVTGYASFGRSAGNLGNIDNSYQLDDGVYWTKGTHGLQMGASLRYRRTWQQNSNANALGSLTFQSQFTAQLTPNAQGQRVAQAGTGDAFADFLLGLPANGQVIGLPLLPYRFTQVNPYIQDTWKVTRNFTLNYGVAWFVSTNPQPVGFAEKLPHGFDYQTGLLEYAALGQVPPQVLSMNWHNFTPRLGFAWQPTWLKNTVIRAGAGTFYSDTKLIEAQFAMVAPPYNSPTTITNVATNPVPQYVLGTNIFPATPSRTLTTDYAAQLPNGTTAFVLRPSNRTPYVNQWNFSIQHSFTASDLVELTYLGASGHNQQNRYEGAQCVVGADLRCNPATKTYPRYASLLTADFNGNSSYEAMVARYHHRTKYGLDLRFEYTFGKALNDHFEGGSNEEQITNCRQCDKGPASFDVKHRAVMSLIYQLPFGHGRQFGQGMPAAVNFVAGGWSVTSIATFATGAPFDIMAPNTTGYGNITHRANRVCNGQSEQLEDSVRANGFKWFDTSCFVAPQSGFYGNAARNVLYGPGIHNWDIGVQKMFPIHEDLRLEFRGEMFNAFNHAQFNAPNASVVGSTFGLIDSARPPRLVQFAMRLLF